MGQAGKRRWGWFVEGIPIKSVRKLLSRSIKAELALGENFVDQLRTVWESPRQDTIRH